jgi:hypothetical protein
VLIGVVVVSIGVAWAARDWLWDEDVTIEAPPSPEIMLTDEEQSYYEYVSPRLRALAGEARMLAAMGAERNRNLFELQARGDNVATLIGEINAFVESNGVPERFGPVMATYREGAVKARQGMDEARQGFMRFDWDRVGTAVPLFTEGADTIDRAADEMDEAVGVERPATPAGVAGLHGLIPAL